MRLFESVLKPLLAAAVCVLAGWPMAASAEVEEVVDHVFLDAPPAAAAETAVFRQRLAPGRQQPVARRYAAATSWRVDWSLDTLRHVDGNCAATNVKIRLVVSITLPGVQPSTYAPTQPHLDRLQLHEAGHLQIARAAVRRVDADLLALAPMPNCRLLHEEAARRATARLEQLQQDQAAYDLRTGHGREPPQAPHDDPR